ncbi:MAG TPA: hypothetical protein VMN81_05105 [Vicinamibacterales bacterium]|nr:hypothetical protein [Vicinamibacterales bacterium]
MLVAALSLVWPGAAMGQQPAVEVAAGVERLAYRYRFDNDSSFDTPFLVPHFFEQRYERTAPQLALRARYRLLSHTMRTAVSFTPESDAFGSDFDTFFQPGGDIAKSGTAGDVRLATVRLDHAIGVFARQDVEIALVMGWQRDRADFLPADRVVTHTEPPSETREFITDRERTVSQTFEVGAEGVVRAGVGTRWQVEAVARLYPSVRARLLVQLPDKYPGRDIVFTAAAWSGSGRVSLTRLFRRAEAGAWVSIEQGGSYRRSAEFDRNAAAAGLLIAFGSRP